MKKKTSKTEWPQEIVEWVSKNTYDNGGADFSVTELLDSPRVSYLRRNYPDAIKPSLKNLLYSSVGTLLHEKISNIDSGEGRVFMSVSGAVVSGCADYYDPDNKLLRDYKYTTARNYTNQNFIRKVTQQLNIYKYMYNSTIKGGYDIENLEACFIFRDWVPSRTKTSSVYPKDVVCSKKIPVWLNSEVEDFLTERVALFQRELDMDEEHLVECTEEERWVTRNISVKCGECDVSSVCQQYKNI